MPWCEGLPNGPCPESKCDGTVRLGEGDLMLCPSCDDVRHRQFLAACQGGSKAKKSVKQKSTTSSVSDASRPAEPCSVATSSLPSGTMPEADDASASTRVSTVTVSDDLTPVDMAVSNINEAKLVVNELLCFVGNNYDCHPIKL